LETIPNFSIFYLQKSPLETEIVPQIWLITKSPRRAEDYPEVRFFKRILTTPITQDQTPSDFGYAGLVVVAV